MEPPDEHKHKSYQGRLKLAMMLSLFTAGLDGGVVNVMLPKLQSLFSVSMVTASLLATSYATVLAAFQLCLGRWADLFGATRVFFAGVVVFGGGSLACACSTTFHELMAARMLQGAGGAFLFASFGPLILQNFPKEVRGSVIGAAMTCISVGGLIGPPLGGVLAEHASWHWAFLVNLPVCLAAMIAVFPTLGGVVDPAWRRKLDPGGALLSILLLLALPIGLHAAAGTSPDPRLAAIALGSGAFLAVAFLLWESRAAHPLVEVGLLRDTALTSLLSLKLLVLTCLNGMTLVFPFFITSRSGLSVDDAGFLMLASALAMTVVTPLSGKMVDRRGSLAVIAVGAAAMVVAALAAWTLSEQPSRWAIALALAGLGAAMAAPIVGASVGVLELAKPGKEGMFAAINSSISSIGPAVGVTVFTIIYGDDASLHTDAAGFHQAMIAIAVGGLLILGLARISTVARRGRAAP